MRLLLRLGKAAVVFICLATLLIVVCANVLSLVLFFLEVSP